MTGTTAGTPFPLGAYLGNPDNSSAVNMALFEAHYASFTADLGAAPQFFDVFVDQSQAISSWIGNAMWNASSAAASVHARTMTPVIGLSLSSTSAGAGSPEQQFQAFAAGHNDATITGIVQAWAAQGFKSLIVRPGQEMNLTGNNYAGDSAQSQADWVAAFQHVSTVLHSAAAAAGVSMNVVWNPSTTNYSNAGATANLYPGDAYVDTIGADVYSDIHPFSDSSSPSYHDWNTGQQDTTVAQFIADPVNRAHYWSSPAATQWSNDGSGGHSQSLDSLIQFAIAHGKPFALPETGAGSSNSGTDVADDAAFPKWLAQELTTAQANGAKIAFANIWDSNGGGNYEFSNPADGKPQEAAAWAQYFGPGANAPNPPAAAATTTAATATAATQLTLSMAEDAWNGDAQYSVAIDGTTVGSSGSVSALNGSGQSQTVAIQAILATGTHDVAVSFLNDAWGGTTDTDRNLYVQGIDVNGTPAANATATLFSAGASHFQIVVPS